MYNPICGIYKITNLINGHCYIGQSRNIKKRWEEHRTRAFNIEDDGYNYPLYKSFRKYGLQNFSFEIIEQCSEKQLNEKENYWIQFYQANYNQTIGQDYQVVPKKLTIEEVQEIQNYLIESSNDSLDISLKQLAENYHVSQLTIRDINVGRSWANSKLKYPLYQSKYNPNNKITNNYCPICGQKISQKAKFCPQHYSTINISSRKSKINITREELKRRIRIESFSQISKDFNVSDNGIRKKCQKLNLPYRKKDIDAYSDEEWAKL